MSPLEYLSLFKRAQFNPRTYKQSHTPTVVQGGGGVDGALPWVFVMLQDFEKISPLVESL